MPLLFAINFNLFSDKFIIQDFFLSLYALYLLFSDIAVRLGI